MPGFKKQYFYSLIFIDINRFEVEEEVRDFYLTITKNSMEKQQQFFLSLANIIEPSGNFFKINDGKSCMATLYGYECRIEDSIDDQDEEGKNLWLTILDLLLDFVALCANHMNSSCMLTVWRLTKGNLTGFCMLLVMMSQQNKSIIDFQKSTLPSNSR